MFRFEFNHIVLRGKNLRNLSLFCEGRKTNLQCSNNFRTKVLLFCALCISRPDKRTIEQIPVIEKLVVNALEVAKRHAGLTDCASFSNNRCRASDPFGFKSVYCDDNCSRLIQLKMAFSCGQRGNSLLGIEKILLFQFSTCHPRYRALKAVWIIPLRGAPRGQSANVLDTSVAPSIWNKIQKRLYVCLGSFLFPRFRNTPLRDGCHISCYAFGA